jgi:hypothetical protein
VASRYQSSSAVLSSIRQKLASPRSTRPEDVLEGIVSALAEGRGYAWAGIFLAIENLGVRQAVSGSSCIAQSQPGRAGDGIPMPVNEPNAEIAVPIRLGARTLGLIIVETRRALGSERQPSRGASRQERVLVEQTAKLVARYLTTDRAKQLLRKTRQHARETAAAQPHKSPQSARPAVRRAAAGDRIPR